MATKTNTNPTLADVSSRMEDGKVSAIVEILQQVNGILDDATFLEANDGTNHKTTIRSGYPTPTWRKLNYGVQPGKSQTVQVKDSCGMLEAYAESDKALVDMSGDPSGFRMSEDSAHIESMNQEMAKTVFYGDVGVNPERFTGLAPRYNSKSAENGQNIIDGGGTGSTNTSIWLVTWGPRTTHMIYPKGSKAGLHFEDKGQVTLEDANKGKYEGYRSHYKWDAGLTVRDWRFNVRAANIDITTLIKTAASGADICDIMVQMIETLPHLNGGRLAFYANSKITSMLRRQLLNKSNLLLSLDEVAGKKVLTFDGIPVRRCDALLNTEARVV